MAEADLSKIVGLIMDNPELVMKIKELANKDEKEDKNDVSTEETPLTSTGIPTSSEIDLQPMQQSQLPVSPRHFMVDVNPRLIRVTSVLLEMLIL